MRSTRSRPRQVERVVDNDDQRDARSRWVLRCIFGALPNSTSIGRSIMDSVARMIT